MACELVPSVTLYGTTQVSSLGTITHTTTTTYLGEPAITLQTLTSTICDDAGSNCRPEVATTLVTITPTVTTTIYSTETRSGLVTNVVPQQTLYYPCSTTTARQAAITGTTEGASTAETSADGADQPAQASTTTSPATPSLSDAAFSARSSTARVPDNSSSATAARSNTVTASSGATAPSSANEVSDTALDPLSGSRTQVTPTIGSSSTADPSATLSAYNSSSSSTSSGPVIAGAVVGTLVGLILFCILISYCRRNRDRGPGSSSKSIGTIDYWERRFRELEADDSGDMEKAPIQDTSASPTSPNSPATAAAGGGSKKLRLTLDLQSKGMSTRPASRLSAISAFFSSKPMADVLGSSPAVPVPVPFAAGQGKSGLNFSRPRFGKRQSAISGVSRVSAKSGKAVKASKQGGAPNSRKSIKSVSNWLNFGAPPVAPSRYAASAPRGDVQSEQAECDGDGRRAMEWMRPGGVDHGDNEEHDHRIENLGAIGSTTLLKRWSAVEQSHAPQPSRSDSPSTPSLLPRHDPLASRMPFAGLSLHSPPRLGRQLTPPKRSTFGMALDHDGPKQGLPSVPYAPSPDAIRPKLSQSSLAPTVSIASLYSDPSTEASFLAAAPNDTGLRTAPRLNVDTAGAIGSTNTLSSDASSPTFSPSNLAAPKSFAAHRQPSTSRKNPPELLLSRDAITPSLWIDEEVYDQFRLGHEHNAGDEQDGPLAPLNAPNARQRNAHINVQRPDQSRFSPDSSIPTLSALPTSSSEDPYGGIAETAASNSLPQPHPQPTDSYGHTLDAYRRRAESAFSSVPPSAAISLAGSVSTCEDDAASASVGTAWRARTARPFDRSAVTPQLPVVHFSGSPMLAENLVIRDADRGTEERMQTMYHVD